MLGDPISRALTLGIVLCLTALVAHHLGVRRTVLALTAVAVGFTPLIAVRAVGSLTVGDVLLVAAIGLAGAAPKPRPLDLSPYLRTMIGSAVVMVTAGAIATLAVGAQGPDAMSNFIAYVVSTILAVLLVLTVRPSFPELRFVLAGYGTGVLVSVFAATRQDTTLYRPTGLSLTSNHLGLACLLGFAIWLALLVSAARRPAMLGCGIAAALCAYGINFSGSRANVGAAAFVLLLVVVVIGSRRLVKLTIAGGVAAGILILSGAVSLGTGNTAINRLLEVGQTSGTVSAADRERAYLYAVTNARIDAHPLTGSGFGDALQGHDLYHQVQAVGGILGLLSLLMVVILTAIGLLRARRDGNHMAAVLWAGYAGYLLAALRSNQWWDRYLTVYLALACVAVVAERVAQAVRDQTASSYQAESIFTKR